MHPLELLLYGLGAYLALGLVFSVVFLLAGGPARIDPAAKGTGWGFRIIVLPGIAIFWPLLLSRWIRGGPVPVERNPHRRTL